MKSNLSMRTQLILAAGILALTAVFLLVLFTSTKSEANVVINDDSFEIQGMYGKVFQFSDVEKIEMKDSMPRITYKNNGSALGDTKKGYFKVDEYGKCLLFLHTGNGPYLYIKTTEIQIIMNYEDDSKLQALYMEMSSHLIK